MDAALLPGAALGLGPTGAAPRLFLPSLRLSSRSVRYWLQAFSCRIYENAFSRRGLVPASLPLPDGNGHLKLIARLTFACPLAGHFRELPLVGFPALAQMRVNYRPRDVTCAGLLCLDCFHVPHGVTGTLKA